MENQDTICLLKECDAGSKMAVAIFDDVMNRIEDSHLKSLLQDCKHLHEKLGDRLHTLLLENGTDDKEPNIMAKGMSHMKTSMKMNWDESDATVAELVTDGCNMGIKSLCQYMNQYKDASKEARDICKQLIDSEDSLCRELRVYL